MIGKPIFSGHETFPLRYGWLKKVYDQVVICAEDSKSIFSRESAIADFGVGKNMVNSMRHWALHVGLLEIDAEGQIKNSRIADMFLSDGNGLDPWFEFDTSIWLVHWALANQKNLVTYYWLFNKNNKPELERDTFARSIRLYLDEMGLKHPSDSTLKRDIECFIRNYTHRKSGKADTITEESVEGPLAELGLINRIENDAIELIRGAKPNLSIEAFLYFLVQFWHSAYSSSSTLSLEAVTYDEGSPGRIFLLDENAIIEYAERIKDYDSGLEWSETAGVRQFSIKKTLSELTSEAEKILKNSYLERADT